jgi:Uma2 family endonuclease
MALPQPTHAYSVGEYLSFECGSSTRHEYFRGEIFAMAGGTRDHSLIVANTARELGLLLKRGPCRVYDSNLRILVQATGLYTYPDIPIICGDPQPDPTDQRMQTFVNPTLLIEVHSPSTADDDRGFKAENYRQIESLREHVLISQDEAVVETFVRQQDGSWLGKRFEGLLAIAVFESVGVELPLSEIYSGVSFRSNGA